MLAHLGFDAADCAGHLHVKNFGRGALGKIDAASLGGDGETWRNWQTKVSHFCKVCAFTAERSFWSLSPSVKVVYVLCHLPSVGNMGFRFTSLFEWVALATTRGLIYHQAGGCTTFDPVKGSGFQLFDVVATDLAGRSRRAKTGTLSTTTSRTRIYIDVPY